MTAKVNWGKIRGREIPQTSMIPESGQKPRTYTSDSRNGKKEEGWRDCDEGEKGRTTSSQDENKISGLNSRTLEKSRDKIRQVESEVEILRLLGYSVTG